MKDEFADFDYEKNNCEFYGEVDEEMEWEIDWRLKRRLERRRKKFLIFD